MRMVVGEPLDVVVEGMEPGRREDPDLTHPAAHPLASHPRAGDGVGGTHDQRPHRRPQALRQAHRHDVRTRAVRRQRDAGGDVRVPDAGAVEVDADPDRVGVAAQPLEILDGEHRATGEVVGVLDRDRRGAHEERPHVGCEHRLDGLAVDLPPRVAPGAHREAGQGAVSAQLGTSDVRGGLAEHLLARLDQRRDGEDVGHRPGGREERVLLAEQRRDPSLQLGHGRVLAVHVVADLGPAIAARIAAVGRVTVSERRSMVTAPR